MTSGFFVAIAANLFDCGQAVGRGIRWAADSRLAVTCLCVGLLLPQLALAANAIGPATGLTLPRFVSIHRNEAYLRAGPGKEYPILAVLQWRDMPVKIVGEYDVWRKVELHDGSGGWLHRVLLDSERTFLIQGQAAVLRAEPSPDAAAAATFQPGVIVHLKHCPTDWCEVRYGRYEGWVPRKSGWGILPGEIIE